VVVLIKIGHVVYQKLYFLGLGSVTQQVHYLSNMKLYPLLFEQEQLKKLTSYTAPNFALFVIDDRLILTHTDSLLSFLKNPPDQVPIFKICAGMIECSERENDCLGAMQVSYAVGSPEWKGAGLTLYALASDYFGSPLTSDRNHSSSVAARETWAKIEKSPEWKKAGEGLDNYAQTSSGKLYVDVQGTYPNRTAEPRIKPVKGLFKNIVGAFKSGAEETQPKTPQEIDDCPLPTKGGNVSEPEKMADLVGTADAYRYTGTLKAAPLVKQAENILVQTANPAMNPKKLDMEHILVNMSSVLFKTRYQGSGTTR
jgi:hypothetical protein